MNGLTIKKSLINRLSFYVIYYILNIYVHFNPWTILLTLPVFLLMIIGINRIKDKYFGLLDFFWLTSYLMFIIRPIQVLDNNKFSIGPTKGIYFGDQYFITSTLILFLFFGTMIILLKKSTIEYNKFEKYVEISHSLKKFIILSIFFILSFLIYVKLSGGLANVLAPRFEKDRDTIVQGGITIFAMVIVLFFFLLRLYLSFSRNNKIIMFPLLMIILLLILIVSNPFNSPRFFLMATWIPIFIILFNTRLSIFYSYLSVIIAIVFIFPILSISSRFGLKQASNINISDFSNIIWQLQYIDTYDMQIYLLSKIDEIGYRYGDSLLGILFFFIPRSIWTDKPNLIALELGDVLYRQGFAGTPNLSMFYGTELFLDFWYFGVIIAGIITAKFFNYLTSIKVEKEYDFLLILMILSSIPIVIRGPLPAVIPLIFFQVISFYLIKYVLKKL